MIRRPRLGWIVAIALFWTATAPAGEPRNLEYAVKANYLYKFADYVTWPADAFPANEAVLCLAGDDPFGRTPEGVVTGKRIGGRAIVIRRIEAVTPDAGCHVLFTRGSARQSTAAALAAVSGKPVLTITEASNFGAGGGIINFVLRDNRVRFEIDQQAAAVNGLEISSKLLALAVTVRPRSGP